MGEAEHYWTNNISPKEEALSCLCASTVVSTMVGKGCSLGIMLSYKAIGLANKPSMSSTIFNKSSIGKSLSKEELAQHFVACLGSKMI